MSSSSRTQGGTSSSERQLTITPIVFVHGTRTSSAIWEEQLAALERAGHVAHAVDLPGHGTREGERFTLAGAMAAIDAAVDSHDAPPLLVGLSLGGYISLAYAAENQQKVTGLVLSGCSTEIAGKPLHLYRRLTGRIASIFRPTGTWHVVEDMLAAMHGYSPLSDLNRLLLPVWLVNGSRDPLRFDERRFVAHHGDARLHVVPGAGHDVNSHAPTAYNRILLDALSDLRAAAPAPALSVPVLSAP